MADATSASIAGNTPPAPTQGSAAAPVNPVRQRPRPQLATSDVPRVGDGQPSNIRATLVEGETYSLGFRKFEKNKPQMINAAEKELLETSTVSYSRIEGARVTPIIVSRFKFDAPAQ